MKTYKILLYLLISLRSHSEANLIDVKEIRSDEKAPKFCETTQFDGIFNYGINLIITAKTTSTSYWYWIYDSNNFTFKDPPFKQDSAKPIEISSYFMSDVPKCQQHNDMCEKADKIFFVRYRKLSDGKESTKAFRSTPNKPEEPVSQQNYPWNLTDKSVDLVWPQQGWEPDKPRPSVYWPKQYEVMFIIYSGTSHLSALIWTNISSIDWYNKPFNQMELKTRDYFVGMFYSRSDVFAIGDRRSEGMVETYVYRIRITDNSREIVNTNISVRQHFRCEGMAPTIPPITSQTSATLSTNVSLNSESDSTTESTQENESGSTSSATQMFIIFVVVFAVILVILFFVILYAFVRSKGRVTSVQTDSKQPVESSVVTLSSDRRHATPSKEDSTETSLSKEFG